MRLIERVFREESRAKIAANKENRKVAKAITIETKVAAVVEREKKERTRKLIVARTKEYNV